MSNIGRSVMCYTSGCHTKEQQVGTLLDIYTNADCDAVFLLEAEGGDVFSHYAEWCKFSDKPPMAAPTQTGMVPDYVLEQCLQHISEHEVFTMGAIGRRVIPSEAVAPGVDHSGEIILGAPYDEGCYEFCFSEHWPDDAEEAVARLQLANARKVPKSWGYDSRFATWVKWWKKTGAST